MPFVLLVLVLLGGGLVCLLVINTTLGATSFRISQLQRTGNTLATRQQALQQQIAAAESPAQIARSAYALGMRVQAGGSILDLGTHRVYRLPGQDSVITPLGAVSTPSPSASGTATAPTGGTRAQTHRSSRRSRSRR
jgi:hypothetical protein